MSHKNKAIDIIPPKHIWVGDKTAPVTLLQFGDYESEACAKLQPVIEQLLDRYEGKLRFQFRHFPLTQVHQRAHKAAEASVAAAQHGRFWEMHCLLFRHRRNLGSISLRDYALEAGVIDKNFISNLTDSVFGWTVRADLLEGLEMGVRTVPALFINGDRYMGLLNMAQLSKAVGSELSKAKQKRA
ncbi:MAG: DsbA family protein [Bacteroidetes bacterium]|nr:DsbA family protein [Bacteroidota bacterium]